MIPNADEAAAIAAALAVFLSEDVAAQRSGIAIPALWPRLDRPRSWSELARIEALELDPSVV